MTEDITENDRNEACFCPFKLQLTVSCFGFFYIAGEKQYLFIVGKYNVYMHSPRHRTEEPDFAPFENNLYFFTIVHVLHKALILAQLYVNYTLDSLSKYPISISFYFCLNFLLYKVNQMCIFSYWDCFNDTDVATVLSLFMINIVSFVIIRKTYSKIL